MKRFNIIYQNKLNKSDIMIKTISEDHDVSILNEDYITKNMDEQTDGILTFSNFFIDKYSRSLEKLIAFRTKIDFPDYQVLLEMETYGGFITNSIKRVIYSDGVNVVVVALNQSDPKGYTPLASLHELNPEINYSDLLETGHKKLTLSSNCIVYCYT